MKEHEHATKPEAKPAHDEVAKKDAIQQKEDHPEGHGMHNSSMAESKMPHAGSDHHAHMAADFRKRFWISLVLTLPILVLSPLLQTLVGLRETTRFPGDIYVLFGLSSAVFWYGGGPFLKGFVEEPKIPAARHDDAGRSRHHDRLSLQQRRSVRPDRQGVLLGAGHPR